MPPLKDRYPLPVLSDAPSAWRSVEERRGNEPRPGGDEFPPGASEPPQGVSRRSLLELAAFGSAALGLSGCFRPAPEKVLPYSQQPPELTPGVALHYATGLELAGHVRGLVVRSNEGRPTKVEGNPSHPETLGSAGAHEQASLLGLYDPYRAREVRYRGAAASRAELFARLETLAQRTDGGAGLRLLVEPTASPLWAHTFSRVLERYPRARVVPFCAAEVGHAGEGARLAFGRSLKMLPRWDAARVVVSLEEDFLSTLPGSPRSAREFVSGRAARLNRLWVAESHLSLTGAFADQRLRVRPSRMPLLARALAAEVGRALGRQGLTGLAEGVGGLSETERRWVSAAARDLTSHSGEALVVVGEGQTPAVHALAHLLNDSLGSARSLRLVEEIRAPGHDASALLKLMEELQSGAVNTLLITAWNPVYRAPADVPLAEALRRVEHAVYCALEEDETAAACSWFVPSTHPYEDWGDGRAADGTTTILQPLIAPMFEAATSPLDVMAAFTGELAVSPYERLQALWRGRSAQPERFQEIWEGWLAEGVIPGTQLPEVQAHVDEAAVLTAVRALAAPSNEGFELHFVPDLKLYDGRFGSNPWLQELPDPLTQLTWDNAACVSPATAERLGLKRGARIRLELRDRSLEAAVLIAPGQADDTVTLPLGYGRTRGSPVAVGVGFNAYALRHQDALGAASGVRLTPVEGHHEFALAQDHWRMEGRALALQTKQSDFQAHPDALHGMQEPEEHLYPPPPPLQQPAYRWGMAIDLHRCTGCSACVVACQAENNIPAVGKEQVRLGREMHWLRIDRYFTGDEHDPGVITQPLMCVHCEYAPCEYVCPVNATVHSDEGLNQMIYNRCIGTRYCSNNCPYKVRRFNYLDYQPNHPQDRMYRNPQVTVRSRGVMEKCTYCVQRIETARITSRVEHRTIRDGEVRTACQQACPTEAIVFGNLNDAQATVTRLHQDPRHYKLLHELGTEPRTVHLVRLKNPDEALG